MKTSLYFEVRKKLYVLVDYQMRLQSGIFVFHQTTRGKIEQEETKFITFPFLRLKNNLILHSKKQVKYRKRI